MTEHYTANTESVTAWCNHCNRNTQHSVSGNRRGRCLEHEAPELSQKQKDNRERLARQGEGLGRNITVQLRKCSQSEELAPCGGFNCAGCYEVAGGIKIHPPRSYWPEVWK